MLNGLSLPQNDLKIKLRAWGSMFEYHPRFEKAKGV